ncbi:MAG: metallophosphoesterase, partial [Patescibacteria group bacterium]
MSLFFDFIITSFLVISLLLALSIFRDRARKGTWEARRKTFSGVMVALLAIGWVAVFYGSFIEPELITVNRRAIDLPNYNGPVVTAALISDIHVGPYVGKFFINRLAKRILKLKPDFLLIGGDIVYNRPKDIELLSPIARATASIRTFAVLGDHDYIVRMDGVRTVIDDLGAEYIKKTMESFGMKVLSNESLRINDELTLVAVNDLRSGKTDLARAFESVDPETSKILLSHNPDIILNPLSKQTDLVLSGNTHGGQVRLPFIGPAATIPDELGQKYDEGLFAFENTQLFITSGVGSSGPRSRLFNPPEIALLT